MKEKNIYLLKNLILFFLASFLPKTISFFLVPLYTNCLSTTEYGTADLLINTVSLCVPILTLVVQDAVMKFTLDNQHDKKIVFTVGIKITCIGFLILSIGCTLLKTIGILKLDYFYILFLVSNYLVSALVEMISYFCRGINQIVILTVSSVAQTMTTIVSNLLFLLVLKSGLKGYLFSILLGYCVNILIVFFGAGLHKYIDFRHRDKNWKKKCLCLVLH
ncbi:lipopolysaccharide biosynthesis protein [Blautia sp. RTP21359st1_E11_RTP21359_211015]|uniref:lipopolysaccharide biosynthesis protein n=1 Tax=Blautia sp. RTP21359st1_E11_RTP21359_211015 TaxID=3141591 RepID=UPI0034A112D9